MLSLLHKFNLDMASVFAENISCHIEVRVIQVTRTSPYCRSTTENWLKKDQRWCQCSSVVDAPVLRPDDSYAYEIHCLTHGIHLNGCGLCVIIVTP